MAKKTSKPITVKVKSEGGELQKDLQLYLFDNDGQLLESTPIKKAEVKLKTAAAKAKGKSQILIGPEIPEEFKNRKVDPMLIKKMGGYQPSARMDTNNIINIVGLPKFKIPIWDWCLVTGSLNKSFTIDGEDKVLPVCDARVHICEIDRVHWLWPYIPELVITDLAERLKEVIVIPEIEVPPIPDPGPKHFLRNTVRPIINPSLKNTLSLKRATSGLERKSLVSLPDNVKEGLFSNSALTVQDTILNNFQLLHPYLCLWPRFWPFFYRCSEIATVYSDCNGNFDFNYLNFNNDKDIYIWVEVNIDGEWVTVYRPPIPCYTHWDYECGKDINIRITDPRVRPCACDPLPGSIIWMRNINGGVSMRKIQQQEVASGHLTNAVGLTAYGASGNISPFGTQFPFVVQFGSGFPATGGVTHYRWKYSKLKNAFLDSVSDTSHDLEGEIKKSYRYTTAGGTLFATKSFTLGPTYDTGRPKYKIPHIEASDDVTEPNAEYYRLDTSSIKINSTELSPIDDGLYEFTFELLDDSGNVVPVPPDTFLMDRLSSDPVNPAAPDANTIAADNIPFANYVVKSGGMAIAFKFKMRIDNTACYADVLDAEVDGSPTDPICGIGHYNDKVNDDVVLKFLAGHEHDFATYNFDVTKGNSNDVPAADSSGNVTEINNGYTISQVLDTDGKLRDLYQKNTLKVAQMLGSCNMAAFAQVLRVHATHTNGDRRLHELDRSDTAAIAIATP